MAVQMRCRTLACQFVALVHHHSTLALARNKIPSTPNFFHPATHHFVQNRVTCLSPLVSGPADSKELILSKQEYNFADETIQGPADSPELILSKEEYNLAVKTIQDKSMTAVLWFTINSEDETTYIFDYLQDHLSERFPHVTIYHFLLDPQADNYEATLKSLNVSSMPTFHFFKYGEKVDELVCEEYEIHHFATYLEVIFEELYKGKDRKRVPELDLTISDTDCHDCAHQKRTAECHGKGGKIRYGGLVYQGFEGLKKFGRSCYS